MVSLISAKNYGALLLLIFFLARMTAAAITELLDKRSDVTDGKPHVILVYMSITSFFSYSKLGL